MHIVGTTMDFVEDELASEFVFHNPNAKVCSQSNYTTLQYSRACGAVG